MFSVGNFDRVMMRPTRHILGTPLIVLISVLLGTHSRTSAKDSPRDVAEREFALEVYPLLARRCFACHGGTKGRKASLDLRSRKSMLRGGASGHGAIVPGEPTNSPLVLAVRRADGVEAMPPKSTDRLLAREVRMIERWIDAGAPWPSADRREELRARFSTGVSVATSGGLSAEWTERLYRPEDIWAYRPLRDPKIPSGVSESPIDAFIDRELARRSLTAAPPADRATLLRRLSFSLTGLPPTLDDQDSFLGDPLPEELAFTRLVDRLLASPRYGEHWGRHWLDVTRYADSAGFANDFERPNAWRFRDYVIRSFNSDKPFDRFAREQLAGDELYPDHDESVIAVGFLRMGPWEHTGMSVASVTRQQFLDDVTASVGQTFLSQPLQCARCHDHKFDPIPTRDYYSIQAVFATTQFADRRAPFLNGESPGQRIEQQFLQDRLRHYGSLHAKIIQKRDDASREWHKARGLPAKTRAQLQNTGVSPDRIAPRHVGLSPKDTGMERICRKNILRHEWELDRYRELALSVYSGADKVVTSKGRIRKEESSKPGSVARTFILTGGDLGQRGGEVEPSTLSAVSTTKERRAIPQAAEGRRAAFALWVSSPRNPLTPRSIVNRVWHYHFSQGIARNPNNFGATGAKPSHPELLDYLASRFIEDGWSIKRLHRRILLSAAYRRASTHPYPRTLAEKDPDGTCYAVFRPRRLSAEEIRDAMLSTSGELRLQIGGVPALPEIHLEAALQPRQIMGTYAPAYQPSPNPDHRHRRTVYAAKIRGLRDPLLEVFNQPHPDESCEARNTSTVPTQALTLLNGRNTHDRALAFAARVTSEMTSREDAIVRAYRLAFGRRPDAEEISLCLAHWQDLTALHAARQPIGPREYPKEIVRRAVDELSGETFEYTERLEAYERWVPDLAPGDVTLETRALADVCRVILSSNEFIFTD